MIAQAKLLDMLNGQVCEPSRSHSDQIYLAISRNNYCVRTDALQEWQYQLVHHLHRLKQAQSSALFLEDLVTQISGQRNMDTQLIYANLTLWLPVAISRGYIFIELTNTDLAGKTSL